MNVHSNRRNNCRLCGSKILELVVKLTPTPPANAFVPGSKLGEPQECFPIDLYQCMDCSHIQLLDVLDPDHLFKDYVYVSGTSPVFVKHFSEYAKAIISAYNTPKQSLIIEVGSNDGTFLKFFQQAGMNILGIDPAVNIARKASADGIETLPAFFSVDLANQIRNDRGAAALVLANNVFAHADDLRGFSQGVEQLLSDDGLFIFEVSYLVDVYEKTLFDTIYHEHVSYHTVGPLIPFFKSLGMEVVDAVRVGTHGGSLRVIVQKTGGPYNISQSIDELVKLESELGLDRLETMKQFSNKIDSIKKQLQTLLRDLKNRGKRLAGYGAPAKATTLMYHFGIDRNIIDYIVDDSPMKQNLYSPGLHIPVLPSRHLYDEKPDYVLILAWNFARPIIENHQAFAKSGGKFIIPVPKVEVI